MKNFKKNDSTIKYIFTVLTYDNNDEDDTVSNDADAHAGTQTKSTKTGTTTSLNDKLDQQLADEIKSIDERGIRTFWLCVFF